MGKEPAVCNYNRRKIHCQNLNIVKRGKQYAKEIESRAADLSPGRAPLRGRALRNDNRRYDEGIP